MEWNNWLGGRNWQPPRNRLSQTSVASGCLAVIRAFGAFCGARRLRKPPRRSLHSIDGPPALQQFLVMGEQQNIALPLVIAFAMIMLLELGQRSPQRSFPEQEELTIDRHSSLTDRTQRSAKAFKFGLRGGSRRHFTPCL
jgi:hypothetical protein